MRKINKMEQKNSPTEPPETRKSLPFGVGSSSEIKTEIIPLVANKRLDFKSIKENPVLKPIANINNTYENLEVIINRALWDYTNDKKQIDDMIQVNPKYSETIILSKFQNILSHVKQIIHAQDIQKDNMKDAINEMIKIVEEEYGLLNEEEQFDKSDFGDEGKKKPVKKDDKKIQEMPEEIGEQSSEEKPEVFYSELLEKSLPSLDTPEIKEDVPKLNE